MKPLNVGDLRTQIVFQEKSISGQDSYGQDVLTWTDRLTAWCQVEALQGRELEAAQQIHAQARFRIRTHFPTAPIKREWRALTGSRVLDILDAEDPFGTRREIAVVAKEWVE